MSMLIQETLEVKENVLKVCKDGLPDCSGDTFFRVTNEGGSISYIHCPKQNNIGVHFIKKEPTGSSHHVALLALHVAHHKKHLGATLTAEAQHPIVDRFLAKHGLIIPSRRLGKFYKVE